MGYSIKFSDTAKNSLSSIDMKTATMIFCKLEEIKEDPFRFAKRLKGVPLFSLRIGDYRVIMDIMSNRMLIFVIRIGHRGKVYNRI
ncbi:MAG: type II toxin-antitoxin system RelE/ParE family toxin [Candidatus Marsarchaeota archaeon]|nr:type II toxin-antitoxin system RelE/ParE family toxin [Candidatus Marsarchaeota archaeon]